MYAYTQEVGVLSDTDLPATGETALREPHPTGYTGMPSTIDIGGLLTHALCD